MVSLPNVQPIEKPDYREDGSIDVIDVFLTLQGEGPLAGTPAVFVRTAGCDLQCRDCDSVYTGPERKRYSVSDLTEKVKEVRGSSKANLVVITGGEPFRQDISKFIYYLRIPGNEFEVQVETNGTLGQHGLLRDLILDRCSIVCSPKTAKINDEIKSVCRVFKYVLDAENVDESDGLPTAVLGMDVRPYRASGLEALEIYVQPCEDLDAEKTAANIRAAIESCMKYGYRLSIQTHKILGLP